MRRAVLPLAAVAAFAFLPAVAAQWRQTNGPLSGSPSVIAMHPTNPQLLLTGLYGLYRTEDGGDSWEKVDLPRECGGYLHGVAFSPAEPDTAYCTIGHALLASHDAGKTWEIRHTCHRSHISQPIVADRTDPKRLYVWLGGMGFPDSVAVQVSKDGGKTFETPDLPKKLRPKNLHCDPHHEGVVLTDGFLSGQKERPLLLSRDSGETWGRIPQPAEWKRESVVWHNLDPEDDELLYVATRSSGTDTMSYWYTYDEGETWELFYREKAGIKKDEAVKAKLAAIFPPEVRLERLRNQAMDNAVVARSDPSIVYYILSGSGGLRRTLDGGKTWKTLTDGLAFGDIRKIVPHPTKPAAAFCISDGRCHRTDDLGAHWRLIMPQGVRRAFRFVVHPLKPDTLFLGDGSTVWRSDDGGETWRTIYNDRGNPFLHAMFDAKDAKTYHFIHPKMLRTTTDDGKTWTERPFKDHKITGKVFVGYSGNPIMVERRTSSTYLLTPGDEPYEMEVGKGERRPGPMAICPTDGSRLAATSSKGLFVSSDASKSWERVTTEQPSGHFWFIAFKATDSNVLFYLMSSGAVIAYNIKTGEQRTICEKRLNARVMCLNISMDGKTIWAGTLGNSVWRLETE